MSTPTPSPTPCASPSRHCADASENPGSSAPWPASGTASTHHPAPDARWTVDRQPGPSVRLKLTLSYAGFLMLAGALLLGVVWLFLLRYVPDRAIVGAGFVPNRSDLLRAFAPAATFALAALLVGGLLGGWLLAG